MADNAKKKEQQEFDSIQETARLAQLGWLGPMQHNSIPEWGGEEGGRDDTDMPYDPMRYRQGL